MRSELRFYILFELKFWYFNFFSLISILLLNGINFASNGRQDHHQAIISKHNVHILVFDLSRSGGPVHRTKE